MRQWTASSLEEVPRMQTCCQRGAHALAPLEHGGRQLSGGIGPLLMTPQKKIYARVKIEEAVQF